MIRRALKLIGHVVSSVKAEMAFIEAERLLRSGSADIWADFYAAQTPEPMSRDAIREIILSEAGHFLTDIEWRYAQARELLNEVQSCGGGTAVAIRDRQLTAEDLNTTSHILTGYTVTNNMDATGTATPGSIRWQALHVVYKGVDYTIADGASSLKYHSFVKPASGTAVTMVSSDTKPTLGPDDILIFINEGGTAVVAAGSGAASLPRVVANGAIDTSALAAGAVTGDRIATGGILAGALGTGAVSASTMFAADVVNAAAIAGGAVGNTELAVNAVSGDRVAAGGIGTGKLGTGAISATTMFAADVVNNAAIADNAVQPAQLNAGAVTAGKIAASAINATNLFTANVVTGTAIANGTVAPANLNTLTHELY